MPSPSPAELRRQARALLRQARAVELAHYRRQVVEWQRAFDEWHAQNPTRSMQEWPAWEAYLDLEAQAEL
jgi:hypothetical protein